MGKPTVRTAGHARRPTTSSETHLRTLSDRLAAVQRPLRVLDALKWDAGVERAFFARDGRELPPVTADYYRSRPLPFDPDRKEQELRELECDVRRRLGVQDAAGRLLLRRCREYRDVVGLLRHRGRPAFAVASRRLYGSTAERLPGGAPALADLGRLLAPALDGLAPESAPEAETVDAGQAVRALTERLRAYFREGPVVQVRLCDGLTADACAGAATIKVRGGARFAPRAVRLLEVHEGWVHLGTTLNGRGQPACAFLRQGPPSATVTQEGLAVLTELLAAAAHPARVRRLADRVEAVARAEAGADFLDVYRFFLAQGEPPRDAYQRAVRVFRGGLPAGCGPFTKDLSYGKGFVLVYNFLRLAAGRGLLPRATLLFAGKTALADVKDLAELADAGLVAPPRFVPPPFADLPALAAWLAAARGLSRLALPRLDGAGWF